MGESNFRDITFASFLLGKAMEGTEEAVVSQISIIDGSYDKELRRLCVYKKFGLLNDEEKMNHPSIELDLRHLKDFFRSNLSRSLEQAAEEDRKERERRQAKLKAEIDAQFRANQAPHAQGTVAELAAKFGVSKSEIRRMKAVGTLDSWLANQQAASAKE